MIHIEFKSTFKRSFIRGLEEQRPALYKIAWSWRRADNWLTKFNKEHDNINLEEELRKLSDDERRAVHGFGHDGEYRFVVDFFTDPCRRTAPGCFNQTSRNLFRRSRAILLTDVRATLSSRKRRKVRPSSNPPSPAMAVRILSELNIDSE